MLCQKAPADPYRVDVGAAQRCYHRRLVEVARSGACRRPGRRTSRSRATPLRRPLVRTRVGVRIGVEHDGADRWPPARLIEFGDRGERADGGLAAVDDAQPLDLSVHTGRSPQPLDDLADRGHDVPGGGSGSGTVRYPSSRRTSEPSSSRTVQSNPPCPSRRTIAHECGPFLEPPVQPNRADVQRQGQDPVRAGLEQADGLEAELDQSRSDQHRALAPAAAERRRTGPPHRRPASMPHRRPGRPGRGSTADTPVPGSVPGCRHRKRPRRHRQLPAVRQSVAPSR